MNLKKNNQLSVLRKIEERMPTLTAKANLVGRYILNNPDQVIFMSVRKLALACGSSESSVMRFAKQLGYPGYAEFLEALRDQLIDKTETLDGTVSDLEQKTNLMSRELQKFTSGMTQFVNKIEKDAFQTLVKMVSQSRELYIIGSGLTFHHAAQLFRELSQIRNGVRVIEANDNTVWNIIAEASESSAVLFFPDTPCLHETIAAAEAFYKKNIPIATLCARLPCPLAAFSTILIIYGSLEKQSNNTALNLPFLIRCIVQALKNENIGDLAANPPIEKQRYLSKNDLFFDKDDILKIGMWAPPTSLDPAFAAGTRSDFPIIQCLYNGLVKYKEGSWDYAAALAENWTVSQDKREIIFHLRQGVMFHRGFGELTSEDVCFSLKRAAKGNYKANFRIMESLHVLDRYTVKLVLKAPCSHLYSAILPFTPGQIVSKRAMEELGPIQFAFSPVGTGPYELDSFSPQRVIKLKRFADYWGPSPKMDAIWFMPIKDQEVPRKAKSGEIDIVRLPFVIYKKVRDLPNIIHEVNQGLDYWLIGINVTRKPFDDLRVRQAIRSAIDVDRIIKKAFWGVPKRAYAPIPLDSIGHWKEAPRRQQEIEKAQQLLFNAIGKKKLKVDLLIMPSETDRIIADIVQENLKQIGIDVSLNVQEVNRSVQLAGQGKCDLYLTFFTGVMDPSTVLNWFHSGERWNFSQWNNAAYDRLIEQADFEMNPKKRAKIYIQAQKIIDQDCWAVWLTNGAGILLRQRHVDTGKTFPDGSLAPWLIDKTE